jgi:hypothetical protein
MAPAKYDLNLYRGDSYGWRFVLWQDVNKTNPVVLTGAVVASEIRDKPSGTKIIPLACTVTLPNIIDVVLNAALCETCPNKGVWDLQITYPDAQVNTPVAGIVITTADVTEST